MKQSTNPGQHQPSLGVELTAQAGSATKEYAFDVKLWTVVRVIAASEEAAREKMADQLSDLIINHEHDGLSFGMLCAEEGDNDELIEIDGEAV